MCVDCVQEGVAKGDVLDESSPGDEGHGHAEAEAKHGGHEEEDTHTHGGAPADHDEEMDDSVSLSVSASEPPQHRYQKEKPHPGQPGATEAEMIAPESPQQVRGEEKGRVKVWISKRERLKSRGARQLKPPSCH